MKTLMFMKAIQRMTLIAVMFGLCMLSAPTHASDSDGSSSTRLYVGPQVGFQQARNADNGKWLIGGAARLKFLSVLGGEAAINYRQEEYGHGAVKVISWPVMATGLFYPVRFLYGAIGAGWYYTTFDYDQNKFPLIKDETKQKFGWHFGAGGELPIGSAKLTADVRYVFLNYDFQQVPGLSGLHSDFFMVTLGILFGI
jgi:hypothetical protein